MKNKLKDFANKYKIVLILGAALIICLEISYSVNALVDIDIDQQKTERQVELLTEMVNNSDAKEKGLNEYLVLWEYDLQHIRDNFPNECAIFTQYTDIEEWNKSFTELLNKVKAEYFSDEEIFSMAKISIPEELLPYIMNDETYFEAISLFHKGLIREEPVKTKSGS